MFVVRAVYGIRVWPTDVSPRWAALIFPDSSLVGLVAWRGEVCAGQADCTIGVDRPVEATLGGALLPDQLDQCASAGPHPPYVRTWSAMSKSGASTHMIHRPAVVVALRGVAKVKPFLHGVRGGVRAAGRCECRGEESGAVAALDGLMDAGS